MYGHQMGPKYIGNYTKFFLSQNKIYFELIESHNESLIQLPIFKMIKNL